MIIPEKLVIIDKRCRPSGVGIILSKDEKYFKNKKTTFEVCGPTYDILFNGVVYKITYVKALHVTPTQRFYEHCYLLVRAVNDSSIDYRMPFGYVNIV